MWLALPMGFVVDTVMAATGLLRYASPVPVEGIAPVWILSLWMGFALTLNHSLSYVMRHWWLSGWAPSSVHFPTDWLRVRGLRSNSQIHYLWCC